MSDVYVYQAALLCEVCAREVMLEADSNPGLDALDKETSDHYPQGPYSDGGGEADCPQHCDHCSAFLENPLTRDGYEYVAEHADTYRETGAGAVIQQWIAYYGDDCGYDPAVMARIKPAEPDDLPACALTMGCLCAGHARGNPTFSPCDTSES